VIELHPGLVRADDHLIVWLVVFVFRHVNSFPAISGTKKGVQTISDLNA
jgi:choline-glycine betaine transporter